MLDKKINQLSNPLTNPLNLSEPYWNQSIEDLFIKTSSSVNGLSQTEADFRLKKKINQPKPSKINKIVFLFWDQVKNPLLLLILLACVLSATVGEFADASIMGFILFASIALSFIQEFRAIIASELLEKHLAVFSSVLRSDKKIKIHSSDVVVGDVVFINAGSLIPADGVLISSKDLFVVESSLTGESLPSEKHAGVTVLSAPIVNRTNCVFMGTSVRSGSGTMLVLRAGSATEFGSIALNLQESSETTKFEIGLREFGYLLTRIMVVFLLVMFLTNMLLGRDFFQTMLFALAIAVGISPQLLPAILSTTLARGSQQLAKKGVIVKRLNAIENLGLMDVLCTDKTGTLTSGVLSVKKIINLAQEESAEIALYSFLNAKKQTGLNNPLDEALTAYGDKLHFDDSRFEKIDELPFDFMRKRLTIIVRKNDENTNILICKGAVKEVLQICSHQALKGQPEALSSSEKDNIMKSVSNWAQEGLRVIGVALKTETSQTAYKLTDEHSFVFYGFILFSDELRKDSLETIKDLSRLGVTLKMITGDNRFVAGATGKQLELDNEVVLTGDEINKLTDKELQNIVDCVQIFAEIDPQQKARIVKSLKNRNHVVGFLGDGINDAAALKASDVGISVQTAVDIARESADIVLVQSGLAVLHTGIVIGRSIFANTKKYILITSSANFGNMVSMALASLFLPFLPLLPTQLLLNNFLTDFPSLLIGTDLVDEEQISSNLRWDYPLIKKYMFIFGGLSSLVDLVTCLLLLFVFNSSAQKFRSGWFIVCVLTELFIIFVIRTNKPIYKSFPSRALLLSSVAVGCFTMLLPYTVLGTFFDFVPLTLLEMTTLVGISIFFFIVSEVFKNFFFKLKMQK